MIQILSAITFMGIFFFFGWTGIGLLLIPATIFNLVYAGKFKQLPNRDPEND